MHAYVHVGACICTNVHVPFTRVVVFRSVYIHVCLMYPCTCIICIHACVFVDSCTIFSSANIHLLLVLPYRYIIYTLEHVHVHVYALFVCAYR